MNRRNFLQFTGVASILPGLSSLGNSSTSDGLGSGVLKAGELNAFLRSLHSVNEPSVDRIIIGDPDTTVRKVGTAWMPYWKTCRAAIEQGVNVLVVHEPTFYTHWDLEAQEGDDYLRAAGAGRDAYIAQRDEKRKWIEDKGLVIIRCHDVLDVVTDFGVPYAFGYLLGFSTEDLLRSRGYYHVYRADPSPAIEVARWISARLKTIGQPGVAFYGDPDYRVSSVGLGTGTACDPIRYMDMNPDLFIAIDDSIRCWIQPVWAEDSGRPLVIVNHGTSEEWGVRLLNQLLSEKYTNLDVVHFEQGCGYRWISG